MLSNTVAHITIGCEGDETDPPDRSTTRPPSLHHEPARNFLIVPDIGVGRQEPPPPGPTRGAIRVAVLDADGRQAGSDPFRLPDARSGFGASDVVVLAGDLAHLRRQDPPDVVVLDANRANGPWADVVAEISMELGCEVVVLAGRAEDALLAFEAGCADCLLAPAEPRRLRTAIARAMSLRDARLALAAARTRPPRLRIELPDRNGGSSIPMGDLIRIEAARDYALIHSASRVHIVRATMTELERALPRPVVRVHRSAMVSLAFVRGWSPPGRGQRKLVLSDGSRVPVGPAYVASTRLAIREWTDGAVEAG